METIFSVFGRKQYFQKFLKIQCIDTYYNSYFLLFVFLNILIFANEHVSLEYIQLPINSIYNCCIFLFSILKKYIFLSKRNYSYFSSKGKKIQQNKSSSKNAVLQTLTSLRRNETPLEGESEPHVSIRRGSACALGLKV